MLFISWLRTILVTLALWCVTLVAWLFFLPNQPAKNLADTAEYTAVLSNVASENLVSQIHALAQGEGYSYILTTSSDFTVGTIYDPAGRYQLDSQVRDSLEQGLPLRREGLELAGQATAVGQQIDSYSLPPLEAESYPEVLLPPTFDRHPIYYQLLISADQPVDGQKLAQKISPSVAYESTLAEAQAPHTRGVLTGIYVGGAALLVLVYLVVMYRNMQGQVPRLRAMQVVGGSRWDYLRRTLAVSAFPSFLVIVVCALISYLYQFTPYSGALQGHPSYVKALLFNSLSLPWVCLALALVLSYLCVRRVRNENSS